MLFKRSRRTLRSIFILGTIQLLAVGTLSYIGYRYVRTSLQEHIPEQLDSIAGSYKEIMGEPLPEEAQSTIRSINDFFKPSTPESDSLQFTAPAKRESVSTIPSHPFEAETDHSGIISKFPSKNSAIQSWINKLEITSIVIKDSGNSRAIIEGKSYNQGEVINRLYKLRWVQSEHTNDGAILLYFSTPEGDIYTKIF